MNKKIWKIILYVAMAFVIAFASHVYTMTHLIIETDGDGDSAFVACLGHEWFMGINGYTVG